MEKEFYYKSLLLFFLSVLNFWFVYSVDSWGKPFQFIRYKSINQSLISYQQAYSVLISKHKNSDSHNAPKHHLISEDIISRLEINELWLITANREVPSILKAYSSVIIYALNIYVRRCRLDR